jgi:RNA polymerase primary sigma factor
MMTSNLISKHINPLTMRQIKITKSITNRESPHVETYLQEIGKIGLVPPEEEVALAARIKYGDEKALNQLIKANLRFVVSVAKQYQNQGLSFSDLINEGNLGLIKAATRFDETRGLKFISYAVWWIRQSILQALGEQSRMVRLPMNKVNLTNKIQKKFSSAQQELEREPSVEELADMLDEDIETVAASIGRYGYHMSLDVPFAEGEESALLDILEDGNIKRTDSDLEYTESLKTDIAHSLTALTEIQRGVIRYYFGIGVDNPISLVDIGEKLNLTKERVRQIKDEAIKKIRRSCRAELLKSYLG